MTELTILYLFLLTGVSIISLLRFGILDAPAKVIASYILLVTVVEITAFFLSISAIHNNVWIYHIFSVLEILLLSLYFNWAIVFFKKYGIGYILGIAGVLFTLYISFFHQSPSDTLNTYSIVIESLMIIGMTLSYFYEFIIKEHETKQFTTPHFWLACIFLLFWSFTFFRWVIELVSVEVIINNASAMKAMMWSINMITYIGFGVVFLFYRKLQPVE